MSIQSEIDRIRQNVAGAYSAVADKGGELPAEQNSAGLAEAVQSIPSSKITAYGDGLTLEGDTLSVTTPVRRILSQVEYDALPEEERNRGLYVIIGDPEDSESGGSSGGTAQEVYSTEERRVGVWLDGKPIYRRTFLGKTPSTGDNAVQTISFDGANIGYIVTFDGKIHTYNDYALELNYCNGSNPAAASCYTQVGTSGVYMTMMQEATRNQSFHITIDYTKTTDPEVTA